MNRLLRKALIFAILVVIQACVAIAGGPVLTGRWGDTAAPQQLVYNFTSRKCSALAVVSFSTACPLARRIVPALNELQREFGAQGVQLIALFPNGMDDLREVAEYAVEVDLAVPIFKDDSESPWHEQLEMTTTPEVVLLDTRGGYDPTAVVYRGQVNHMWFGGGAPGGTRQYLRDAIESFLAGAAPPIAATAASGCRIAKHAPRDLSRFRDVTYYQDISRLISKRCHDCHREGEPGAELFSTLDSYEVVAGMSGVILDRIENRLMPPWHASMEANSELGGFKNDPRLSKTEISTFRAWVELGCPPGDPAHAPEQIEVNNAEWKIGAPDFIFEMPEPYLVPKRQLDEYQYYRVPASFAEDRYIQAIEVQPGNKAVVHHIGAMIGPELPSGLSATQAMLRLYGLTGQDVRKVGDYVAGDPFNARTYEPGYALKLPAGQDLYFEIHYTPTGKQEKPDLSRMGIIWAKEKPEHVLDTKIFNRKDILLRPHDGHYEMRNYYMFPTDVLIYALGPHMHFRGKDFTLYKATNPDTPQQSLELILRVSTYDFDWQRTYEFFNPLSLKAGEALYSVTHYDNSHFNPNNLDPEATVRYGLQSEEEMLNLRVKLERVAFD